MRICWVLAVTALTAGCTPPKSEAAERAEVLAAGVSAIAPKDVGGGVIMSSAHADGSTLTLTFKGIPASELELLDFDRQLTAMICDDPGYRSAIDKDVDIRIEMNASDGRDRGVTVSDCR